MLSLTNEQKLKDMAELLGVTSAFLSAVENGKKSMPDSTFPPNVHADTDVMNHKTA